MKTNCIIIATACFILTACGSSEPPPAQATQSAQPKRELNYTVAEFDAAVEKLYGASPEEVVKKFGKPHSYDRDGNGDGKFGYSGVFDPVTGMYSSSTFLMIDKDKLRAEKPTHYFK